MRRAGIDVAVLVYKLALGEPQPVVGPWREGVRLWFPLRDTRAARTYRRAGETTWPRWLGSLMRPRVYLPVLAFDDLRPTFYDLGRRIARTWRRRLRQLDRASWCASLATALAAQEALASLAPMISLGTAGALMVPGFRPVCARHADAAGRPDASHATEGPLRPSRGRAEGRRHPPSRGGRSAGR